MTFRTLPIVHSTPLRRWRARQLEPCQEIKQLLATVAEANRLLHRKLRRQRANRKERRRVLRFPRTVPHLLEELASLPVVWH